MVSMPRASSAPATINGVHADASQRAAIDVDGIDAAGGHDFVHLLEDAIEGDALGRIDFHAKRRILCA